MPRVGTYRASTHSIIQGLCTKISNSSGRFQNTISSALAFPASKWASHSVGLWKVGFAVTNEGG